MPMQNGITNKRQRDILGFLNERTWVSTLDIVSLFIPNLKYCRRVMAELCIRNLVKQVQCPVDSLKGPGLCFYALLPDGAKLINFPHIQHREPRPPTSLNLLHYYIINAFLTGIHVLAKQHAGLVINTMSEKQIRSHNGFQTEFHHRSSGAANAFFAIPDFVFAIGDGVGKSLFFGEADTCSENLSFSAATSKTIANKFKTFSAYKELEMHEFFAGSFEYEFSGFTYLHITTGDENRLKHLVQLCRQIGGLEDVLLTSADRILPERSWNGKGELTLSYDRLIAPVWIRVGDTSGKRSSILE
jgi:hypothetical protein